MTERTNEPSQDNRRTARPNNSSNPDQRGTLSEQLEEAVRAREAMSPVDRALHDSDQRRSFVRGQCGRDPGPDVLAEEVQRLRAEVTRLSAERDRLDTALAEANKLFPMRLRGGEPDPLARAIANLEIATARADRAEAELSALKARVAEVLEPFLRPVKDIMPHWPDDDYATLEALVLDPLTIGDFRRASELHATLSGEQK